MYKIKNYTSDDYKEICSWWKSSKENPPFEGQLPELTTFILHNDKQNLLCISVIITNADFAYIENFISNPEFNKAERKEATQMLLNHASNFAKKLGFKYALGITKEDKLAKRYFDLGFTKQLKNISVVCKEL